MKIAWLLISSNKARIVALTKHRLNHGLAEQLVREKSPKEMREELSQRCARILATYREKCSEGAPSGYRQYKDNLVFAFS